VVRNCICFATCRVREHNYTLESGVSLFQALNSHPNRHLICPNRFPIAFSMLIPVLTVLARDRAAQSAETVFVLLLATCYLVLVVGNLFFVRFSNVPKPHTFIMT
jgi:hypothetical protein